MHIKPYDGDNIPLVTNTKEPFEGDTCDWFYHDPRTDISGIITITTIDHELREMWERSNWVGGEEISRENLRTPGIYRDTELYEEADYNNFTIVIDTLGCPLVEEACKEFIDRLNEKVSGPDFELRPDLDMDDLPDIAVECDECHGTMMRSDANTEGREWYCDNCYDEEEVQEKIKERVGRAFD